MIVQTNGVAFWTPRTRFPFFRLTNQRQFSGGRLTLVQPDLVHVSPPPLCAGLCPSAPKLGVILSPITKAGVSLCLGLRLGRILVNMSANAIPVPSIVILIAGANALPIGLVIGLIVKGHYGTHTMASATYRSLMFLTMPVARVGVSGVKTVPRAVNARPLY